MCQGRALLEGSSGRGSVWGGPPATVTARMDEQFGPLALVGGGEWSEGCSFDAHLWELSGRSEVLVLPTAAAYEHPQRAVEVASGWFDRLGAQVRGLMVLTRRDAYEDEHANAVGQARFIYLSGGSPMHLRSVLKDTPVWEALVGAWRAGAVVAG